MTSAKRLSGAQYTRATRSILRVCPEADSLRVRSTVKTPTGYAGGTVVQGSGDMEAVSSYLAGYLTGMAEVSFTRIPAAHGEPELSFVNVWWRESVSPADLAGELSR